MIANFFQGLKQRKVAYLLISGQATVLYGAATFSEDIDLWIAPEPENCRRFMEALRDSGARYYKLTPALTVENVQRGHGFHFVLGQGREEEFFLDVMGVPPRVGPFTEAARSARWMETEWGTVHTIGLQALVELKKTQRLEDYPIISRLALAWFEQPECAALPADYGWAVRNIFTLPELRTFFEEHPDAFKALPSESTDEVRTFAQEAQAGSLAPDVVTDRVNAQMQNRIAELQKADRSHWREVIADLKRLRAAGELMAEGAKV